MPCAAFARPRPRRKLRLVALNDDVLSAVLDTLRDTLDPRVVLTLSRVCRKLWRLTQSQRADAVAAANLCRKLGFSCTDLRRTKRVLCFKHLSTAGLKTFGMLGPELLELKNLLIGKPEVFAFEHQECRPRRPTSESKGLQLLLVRLAEGAPPKLRRLTLTCMDMGNPSASALARALSENAPLAQLRHLCLLKLGIDDSQMQTLSPVFRLMPMLTTLCLSRNRFGDAGLFALLELEFCSANTPAPFSDGERENSSLKFAGASLVQRRSVFKRLKTLDCSYTDITRAGCRGLLNALARNELPALKGRGEIEPLRSKNDIAGLNVLYSRIIPGISRGLILYDICAHPLVQAHVYWELRRRTFPR